ncbi:MAG: hypothetical protein ACRC6B_06745, partial [Fusobacteriaceae bacterium]
MNNIGNEERILKRYLKKKMSFNQESVVKFLITGLIGITLTACGGGGGGGSSSTPAPTPPSIEKPEEPAPTETITKDYEDEGHDLTGGNFVVAGTVSGDKENLVGITATNANVESKATITLTGDGAVGIDGKSITTLSKEVEKYQIENSDKINLSGKNATGMLLEGNVVGINSGTIEVSGETSVGMKGTGVELINKGTIVASGNGSYIPSETPYEYDGTHIDGGIGILGDNSQISNSGRIETSGTNGVGILGNNGSKVTNEELGTIIGTGKGEFLADENGIVLADTIGSVGIKVNNNSEAINYGKIEMAGAWTRGMQAYNQSKIVNEGTINLNSESQYSSEWYEDDGEMEYDKGLLFTRERGMVANTGSIALNNGEINAYGSAAGMEARNESKAYNNGDIYIEGKIEETKEDIFTGWEGYDTNYVISNSRGMDIRDNSYGENNGSISLIGGFGTGILARDTSEAINKGDIYLESSSQLVKELCEHDDPNENHI